MTQSRYVRLLVAVAGSFLTVGWWHGSVFYIAGFCALGAAGLVAASVAYDREHAARLAHVGMRRALAPEPKHRKRERAWSNW